MALSTKSLIQWAESIRNMFKMEASAARGDGLPSSLPDANEVKPGSTSAAVTEESEEIAEQSEEVEMSLSDRMEEDKKNFLWSKEWAKDEERLFQILYLRQDLPMFPSQWRIDLRGFPLTDHIFETSEEFPPVIYSHAKTGSGQFAATHVLTQLIDLTLSVRTMIESENLLSPTNQRRARYRVARLIKTRLTKTLAWAARDGSYDKLKFIPNIAVEIVEGPEELDDAVAYIEGRMKALATLQREFLRVDRSDDFWTSVEPRLMRPKKRHNKSLPGQPTAGMKRNHESTQSALDDDVNAATPSAHPASLSHDTEHRSSKRRQIASPCSSDDELPDVSVFEQPFTPYRGARQQVNKFATTPPQTPASVEFRRTPPVVYGLYIMGTSVLILTLDSAKGDAAKVSFHVTLDFFDKNQSIWNAITLVVPVCAARDELMSRLGDFEPLPVVEEPDPDA